MTTRALLEHPAPAVLAKDYSLNVRVDNFVASYSILLLHGPQTCIPSRAGTINAWSRKACKKTFEVEYLFAFDMRLDQRPWVRDSLCPDGKAWVCVFDQLSRHRSHQFRVCQCKGRAGGRLFWTTSGSSFSETTKLLTPGKKALPLLVVKRLTLRLEAQRGCVTRKLV